MDQLFVLCNAFAIAGWVLLAAAPRWRWTERLVLSGVWSVALAVVYTALVASALPGAEGSFNSIAGVRALFANDALLTAGWTHYLAFDLMIGALEVRLANRDGLPHIVVIPILFLTLMLGPVGLLAFFITKSIRDGRIANLTGFGAI
jgi:ABA DEFICIENT 4-like